MRCARNPWPPLSGAPLFPAFHVQIAIRIASANKSWPIGRIARCSEPVRRSCPGRWGIRRGVAFWSARSHAPSGHSCPESGAVLKTESRPGRGNAILSAVISPLEREVVVRPRAARVRCSALSVVPRRAPGMVVAV